MSPLWIILYGIIYAVFAHDHHQHHNCIHDQIEHELIQQHIKYKSDSGFDGVSIKDKKNGKRNLLQSTQYKPIRIRPYYDPNTFNILPYDKQIYIKELISTSILYLEQFVYVIPVDGPLILNRCQRSWFYDEFTYSVCPKSEYMHSIKCQYAQIPEAHLGEAWYYDEITKKSTLYKKSGSGIHDTDLIIYITYSDGQCVNGGDTLAWASICNIDQNGRPIAGTINFCPSALQANYWKFDVSVTLHELMHIVIMSNSLFPYFYDITNQKMRSLSNTIIDEIESGTRNVHIITPEVTKVAKTHFGCDSLIGAPLENDGSTNIGTIGSHWESKYFQYELMCGTIYSAISYVSKFTLALMVDSGWYAVDYNYADDYTWGYKQGCNFINSNCANQNTKTSNFGQFWCQSVYDDGCSFDSRSISDCVNLAPQGNIPKEFQWYSDSTFGGPSATDYCAFRKPETNANYPDFEKVCWDIRGNSYASTTIDYPSSKYGIDSRCIEINDGTFQNGYCFQFECINFNVFSREYGAVKIMLSDGMIDSAETMVCLRRDNNQYKESNTYGQYVKCPNIDSVCGHSSRPFACVWGTWNDNLNKCICNIGYRGQDCSIIDDKRMAIEATSSLIVPNFISPQYGTGICIRNSISSIIDGYYEWNELYEGLPSYQHNIEIKYKSNAIGSPVNTNLYLYFVRYFSQWSIGVNKGDSSVYAYCKQSVSATQVIDIQYCRKWAVWDDVQSQWQYDTGLSVYHCTPTYSPTTNPTYDPTLEPTFNPSISPTLEPTTNPTMDPTWNPTQDPTQEPTSNPTIYPTTEPTIHPTFEPTFEPTLHPTSEPTIHPTGDPTFHPTVHPTLVPTVEPTVDPTIEPSSDPSIDPTLGPTFDPTIDPTIEPTVIPSMEPTWDPTINPSIKPTNDPTNDPTTEPSIHPTVHPTFHPTNQPTFEPTIHPTISPTFDPSIDPTFHPTFHPISDPTSDPSVDPTTEPTFYPTSHPTIYPTTDPSSNPIFDPTDDPTLAPTIDPTIDPTTDPTRNPSHDPSVDPTIDPTQDSSNYPTYHPTHQPTYDPTLFPTDLQSINPSDSPTNTQSIDDRTDFPTYIPTEFPSYNLTETDEPKEEEEVENEFGLFQPQIVSGDKEGIFSKIDEWFIFVFIFLGTCICMNILFICVWFYIIKPRRIDGNNLSISIDQLTPQDGNIGQDTASDLDQLTDL